MENTLEFLKNRWSRIETLWKWSSAIERGELIRSENKMEPRKDYGNDQSLGNLEGTPPGARNRRKKGKQSLIIHQIITKTIDIWADL